MCACTNEGLIYRGNRMVNWCPHCNTSISDAEVEYEAKDGSFWHLLYPVKETGEMLELATTRPETMLGDTAVAINAEDPRYKHLHGCHVDAAAAGHAKFPSSATSTPIWRRAPAL